MPIPDGERAEEVARKEREARFIAQCAVSQPTTPVPDGERVREYERLVDAVAGEWCADDPTCPRCVARADLDAFVLPQLAQPAASEPPEVLAFNQVWAHCVTLGMDPLAITGTDSIIDFIDSLAQPAAQQDALRTAAIECADDLEAWIQEHYCWPNVHPAEKNRYERDMGTVRRLRAALAATEDSPR